MTRKKTSSRIVSLLLAMLMIVSMIPTTIFAAPASDIPDEMLDNVYLDALAYTGYQVQAQKNDGTIYKTYGPRATAYGSDISYGLTKYGTETVTKSDTATGLAPDIAGFENSGLCCASYVSYVYYNYLPNIAGIDTSSVARPSNPRSASSYNTAANNWVNAGTARRISFTQSLNGDNFNPREEIPIGSLIVFKHIPTGDIAHVAIYAGCYNGNHFVTHTGNDRGPEFSTIVGMSKGNYPEAVVQVVVPQFVEESGKIEVYKKDPNGAALSGAYFKATNTETNDEFIIGPTNNNGYACTQEDVPYGTYKIVETVFPTDYTYSGTKEWTRTVSSANDGVVTINAVNELKKGNIEVYKKNTDGAALSGAIFTVYNSSGTKVTTIGPTNDRGYAKSADIPYGTYKVVETTFPFNYEAAGQTEWTVTINTAKGALATINASNQLKKGHIEILKSDAESGKDLSGAEFTVYDYEGEEIAVIGPTNKDGYAKSGEIIYGDYIVKETKIPANYQADGDAEWRITLDDNSSLITLDVANLRQYGSVKVVKTAEDGLVEGLVFTLNGTSVYGEKVSMTATTNAAGVAVFERVPIGEDYVIAEKNTPVRYVIPENQTVNVYWNKVSEREFDNVLKKWRADVFKIDSGLRYGGGGAVHVRLSLNSDAIVEDLGSPYGESQGDASLAGAVYGVYRYDELVDTYTTDKNGYFLTDYYPCGEGWNIREITPSEGYLLDYNQYWLDVEPGNYTVELNTEELDVYEDIIMGGFYLLKHKDNGDTQIETEEPGAEFEVYLKSAGSYENAKETERGYLITDEYGYAEIDYLPYGVYTVKQVKGSEGVELLKPFDVFIEEAWTWQQFIINNAPFTSYVKVQKTDAESGLPIPYAGAAFQLYNPDGTLVSMQYTYPEVTVIDTFYTNEDGYLITPEKLGYGKDYYLVEVKAPYGYVLNSDPVYFDITEADSEEEAGITVVNVTRSNMPQKGVIHIEKTGEVFQSVVTTDNLYKPVYEIKGLAGAVFEIRAAEDIYTLDGVMHYAKGELVDTITTGSDGMATSKELYLGKYTIQEITAPHGMVLNGKVQTAQLVYAGQEIAITETSGNLYNERQKVKVSLSKVLEQNELFGIGMNGELGNISFGLYAQTDLVAADGSKIPADGLIEIITFDENGMAIVSTDLPLGSYYLKERSTDDHYILNNAKFGFEFTYGSQEIAVVELTVNNGAAIENDLKYGSVSGLKLDEDGKVIKGAVFGLFSNDENEYTRENAYMVTESAEDGTFKFENIPYGTWVVREIQPAVGFVLNEKAYQIVITDDGQVVEIQLENRYIRGDIAGLKVDEDGTVIAGAKFGLFKPGTTEFIEENAVLVTESDSEGKFRFEDIRFGKWIVRELVPATGYVLGETPIEVNIQTEGEVIEISFENKFIRSDIKGYKVDEDGKPVAGALFGLFTESDTEFTEENAVLTAQSDADGIFLFEDVRFGKWIVKELKPATGFVIIETEFPIDVTTDGAVIEIKAENRHIYGMVHTTKVDMDYPDNLLAGATFEIYLDVNGNKEFDADVDTLVGEMVEYEPGLYELEELRYGGYFLYEKVAPANYVKDDTYHYFEIVNDGEMVEVENEAGVGFINNHMVGNLKIAKTSSDGRLEGFSFRVVGDNYDKVFVTNDKGEIFIENLRIGKYAVTEVEDSVSADYKRPDPVEVELVADETLTVNVHNDKITVDIPQTGDNSHMGLWISLLALSLLGMAGTVFYGRRRKREELEG
ncbi:MAG: SpaA isopeptide-forming pilin-related protein [Eubacteriales bacterium]|nr:SpaA isopeptide-forming pilin-related protein [Eubacteriales bacterium]